MQINDNKLQVRQLHQRGFTLMELLIVLVIISVLAAIVFPSYQRYVKNTQRSVVKGQMVDLTQALERYKTQNFSYEGATPALDHDLSNNKFYTAALVVNSTTHQSFTITATPKSGTILDGDGTLQLDSNGNSCYVQGTSCTVSSGSSW